MSLFLLLALSRLAQEPSPPSGSQPVPWVIVERPAYTRYDSVSGHQLAKLEDGTYIASFEHRGHYNGQLGTYVCRSRDRGGTWTTVAKLASPRYTSLFVKGKDLYLLGVDGSGRGFRGNVLISRSTDQGETWTTVPLRDDRYQATQASTIEHEGRFWRPFIRSDDSEGVRNYATVASAPVGSDLLSEHAWRWSEELQVPAEIKFGWFLSCMLSDGGPTPVLLVRSRTSIGAVADPSLDGSTLALRSDPTAWTNCEQAMGSRLTRDAKSESYFVVRGSTSEAAEAEHRWEGVELASSSDLVGWQRRSILLRAPGPSDPNFGGCDWVIEDEDLLVIQTAKFRAPRDSPADMDPGQAVIFYRVPKFRDRKPDDPPLWGSPTPK